MKHQHGFTLVEMAIVLVIIGLILAGIMNGANILRSGKTADTIAIAKDLSAASSAFRDKYKYYPGDFPLNPAGPEIVGMPAACAAGGNGDGQISLAESACAIAQLSGAGFIRQFPAGGLVTRYGGAVRIISRAASNVPTLPAQFINIVEFQSLPCDAVMEMEVKLDNNNIATGNARANVASCTVGGANDPVPYFALPL